MALGGHLRIRPVVKVREFLIHGALGHFLQMNSGTAHGA
jgi:hypothetical protein